jgi:hypothetical protein
MKRAAFILLSGVLLCAAAYLGVYELRMAPVRHLAGKSSPELGWLKEEFHVSDAEFARISELHRAYQPRCAERCRRIDAKNAEIKEALAQAGHLTPEIQQKLVESQQLRTECETSMIEHFYEVSRSMPPDQARRYLAWVGDQTFPSQKGMGHMAGNHEH